MLLVNPVQIVPFPPSSPPQLTGPCYNVHGVHGCGHIQCLRGVTLAASPSPPKLTIEAVTMISFGIPSRVLGTRSTDAGRRTRTSQGLDAGGRRLSMAQETLILTEENVIAVLAEVWKKRRKRDKYPPHRP